MSAPTTRQAYEAVYEIWDSALEDPKGIRMQLADFAAANHLRMRLHQARSIARKDNLTIYDDPAHPMHGASIYDKLQCRIYTDADRITWLYIEPRTADVIGRLQPLSQVEDTRWQAPNSQPQLTSHTGTKLLTKRLDSESNASTDDSSSTPSMQPEKAQTIPGLRRL